MSGNHFLAILVLLTLKATSEIVTKTLIGLILILKIWRTLISPFMGPLFRYTVTSTMGSKGVNGGFLS